jgi:iron-sulfur cluster assembly accessory protein
MVSACAEDVGPVEQRPLTPLQKRMLAMQNVAVFSLTARAVERVKYLLSLHQPKPAAEVTTTPSASSSSSSNGAPTSGDDPLLGIRIGVKKRGCSGYSYVVNYQYESTPPRKKGDARVNQEGLSVFVDGDAMFYVVGTVMDYSVTDVEEKFTFVNPNQKTQCGCAESFNV